MTPDKRFSLLDEMSELTPPGEPSALQPADPAPNYDRVVTVGRTYYFAPGRRSFYGAQVLQVDRHAAALTTEQAGARTAYSVQYLRDFAAGETAEPLSIDVQRVIVYEWLRSMGA